MTQALTGRPVELTASGATPGLVGQITVEAYDPTDGSTLIAARTTGISEPRSGTYAVALTFPTAGDYIVRWADPSGNTAEETVSVSASATVVPASPAQVLGLGGPVTAPSLAQAGVAFEAWANGLAAGLDVTLEVDQADGTPVSPAPAAVITEPQPGEYRAVLTIDTAGQYRLRWVAGTNAAQAALLVTDITPSLEAVSALMYDRLIREGGGAVTVFDDTTQPSAEQVTLIMRMAVADIIARVGRGVPAHLVPQGRYLAALWTAIQVEQVYAPEQTDASASYDALSGTFAARFAEFVGQCRTPARVPVA